MIPALAAKTHHTLLKRRGLSIETRISSHRETVSFIFSHESNPNASSTFRTRSAEVESSQEPLQEEAERRGEAESRRANVPKAKYLYWLHVFICFDSLSASRASSWGRSCRSQERIRSSRLTLSVCVVTRVFDFLGRCCASRKNEEQMDLPAGVPV